MQIISDHFCLPSGRFQFLDCEIEQRTVVCLEFQCALFFQDHIIACQKLPGQASLGMAVLRPGIGEVQLDPVDLSLPEYLVDIFGIHADEFQIGKLIFLHFLDRTEQDTGIFFNAHIVDLRI